MRNGIFILTSWPWKYGGTAAQKVLNESYGLQAMQAPYGKRVLMVIIGGLTTAVFLDQSTCCCLPDLPGEEDYLVSDTDTRSYTEDWSFYIVLLYNWLVGG
jgi:hypothetical protein